MQLQFKVEHKKNLKRHEFDKELVAFANDRGHRDSDMMILAILSHGREGNVFASDGTVIAIESIYEKFNNKNCPDLQGKPKFFIIQVRVGRRRSLGLAQYLSLNFRHVEATTPTKLTSITTVSRLLRKRPAKNGGTAKTPTRSTTSAR